MAVRLAIDQVVVVGMEGMYVGARMLMLMALENTTDF